MQQLLTGKKRLLDENGVRFSGEWLDKDWVIAIMKYVLKREELCCNTRYLCSKYDGFVDSLKYKRKFIVMTYLVIG
jgi:hypothetical protein